MSEPLTIAVIGLVPFLIAAVYLVIGWIWFGE